MEKFNGYRQLGLDPFKNPPHSLTATDGTNNYDFAVGLQFIFGQINPRLMDYSGIIVTDKALQQKVTSRYNGQVIGMESLEQISEPSFALYDHTIIAAMRGIDLTGERVIDFGSGTGLLSIIALLQGANRAVMVEKDEKLMNIARGSVSLNNLNPEKCVFIRDYIEFLSNPAYCQSVLDSTVAIANIGPQPIYGGEKGLQFSIYRRIEEAGQNIKRLILGGFAQYEGLLPDPIVHKYGTLGFHEVRRVWMEDKLQFSPIAVVLERQPAVCFRKNSN